MKLTLHILIIGFGMILLIACSPDNQASPTLSATAVQVIEQDVTIVEPVAQTIPPSEPAGSTVTEIVVTPRGDQLVATEPSTVALAGGTPTLVEFFRFT